VAFLLTCFWIRGISFGGSQISPWHDIPLRSSSGEDGDGTLLNFVVEIPKRTKAKMEVATEEQPYTPIKREVALLSASATIPSLCISSSSSSQITSLNLCLEVRHRS
jgi:hypothetical protein